MRELAREVGLNRPICVVYDWKSLEERGVLVRDGRGWGYGEMDLRCCDRPPFVTRPRRLVDHRCGER